MKQLRELKRFRSTATKALRFAAAAVSLAAVAACSSSETSGPSARPTGNWEGTLVSGTFSVDLNLTMVEDAAGKVTGNGFLSSAISGVTNNTAAVTVTGTFAAPTLSANLSSPGFTTMNLTGRITGDTFNARLNGSGFSDETMVLTRQ